MSSKHTPGPWAVHDHPTDPYQYGHHVTTEDGLTICSVTYQLPVSTPHGVEEATRVANARLIAAAPELLAELQRAQEFIDSIRQELHQRRVADWYPEGAHNAADQMSADMRLLGNTCADFDTSAVIAKATGAA
ncbi:MAG TPA: hypothetical protein VIO83_09455 [Pseudomonas sp.]